MITITFDFKNRKESDLEQLNALLATMKLQDLKLEDAEGYLATTSDRNGNIICRRYGLDSGTLICKLSKAATGYRYRIDTAVADRSIDHNEYLQCWRDSHPDRVMRIVITEHYDEAFAYTIVHHQRV